MIFLNSLETKYNLLPKELNNKKNVSQESNLCPICLDKKSEIHVNPCGHMFCFDCIKKLTNRKCPICRTIMVGIKEYPEFKFDENILQSRRYVNAIPIDNNNVLNNAGILGRIRRIRRGGRREISNFYQVFSGNID